MTTLTDATPQTNTAIEESLVAFERISQDLLAGYQALAERAERVEHELSLKNRELAERIAELDAVKGHVEAILESLPTGVVVRNPAGVIVRINSATTNITQQAEAEIRGKRAIRGMPPLPEHDRTWSECRLQRPDGSEAVLARRICAIDTKTGPALGTVEILDDRTELARVTARMQMQEKMAALGTMAGGIAHEIRNPLNAVKGFASLLSRELPQGTKESRWAERIQQGVNEADAIIASLLSFAQPERLRLENIDLPELVKEVVALVLDGRSQAQWQFTVDCPALPLRADRIQLRQALRNLVANAMEAQGDCGAILIRSYLEGREAVLSVADAGPGIPPQLANKIFEPFFTTRADGTGLGLAIVHTILRLHGGRLEIATEPSPLGGATVRLRLPLASNL